MYIVKTIIDFHFVFLMSKFGTGINVAFTDSSCSENLLYLILLKGKSYLTFAFVWDVNLLYGVNNSEHKLSLAWDSSDNLIDVG